MTINTVKQAARHVLRQRMTKRAYDDNWVDTVKYLAETGQLSQESIEALKAEYEKGLLAYTLQRAGKGALSSAKLGFGLGAASGAIRGGLKAGLPGVIGGAGVGGLVLGGASALLGGGLNGIMGLMEHNKNKEQLKSILDKLPPEAVGGAPVTTPDDTAVVASI